MSEPGIMDELAEAILEPGIDVRIHSLLARLRVELDRRGDRVAELEGELRYVAKYLPPEVNERARAVLAQAPDNLKGDESQTRQSGDY